MYTLPLLLKSDPIKVDYYCNFSNKPIDSLKSFINCLIFDKYNQNELSKICSNKNKSPISDILYILSDNDKKNSEKLSYASIALVLLFHKTKTMSSEILIQDIFGLDSNKNYSIL